MVVLLLPLSMLLSTLSGCGRDRCAEPVCWEGAPRIAFAVTEYNAAWAHRYSGWYIDHAGSLFTVSAWHESADSLWLIEEDGLLTLPEIGGLEHVWEAAGTTVNADSVQAMFRLLRAAAEGPFVSHPGECADCGVWHYVGMRRDCEKEGYKMVLLYQGGEERMTNESPEAARLHEWLENIISGL
jgi:hypothetical protein